MSFLQINLKYLTLSNIIAHSLCPSSPKKNAVAQPPQSFLLLTEGHAVGALVNCGVGLVSADQDLVQRAVVGVAAMVSALLNGALDALVCMAVHTIFLL